MNPETLEYTLAQWRQAGARRLKLMVAEADREIMVLRLCCMGLEFYVDLKYIDGILVFVVEI